MTGELLIRIINYNVYIYNSPLTNSLLFHTHTNIDIFSELLNKYQLDV